MKDLFIPYELAVIAKEKGFNELCLKYFDRSNELTSSLFEEGQANTDLVPECTAAPLYQQIIDWLRFEKGLAVYSIPSEVIEDEDVWFVCNPIPMKSYGSYSSAIDAIKHAFELI